MTRPTATNKRVTQKDVARHAGVSQAMVSAVVGARAGSLRLSQATRLRVESSIRELNYQPNHIAQAMRTKRLMNLVYFVPTSNYTEVDFPISRAGLVDTAEERGYTVMIARMRQSTERDYEVVPRVFKQNKADAIIVFEGGFQSPALDQALAETGLPIVYLNDKRPSNSVYIDDHVGGRRLTEHLLAQGCRRIAYYGDAPAYSRHYSGPDRIAGYREAMQAAGLAAEVHFGPSLDRVEVTNDLTAWLSSQDRPEAIVCYSDGTALLVVHLLVQMKIPIPREVAITGYNNQLSYQNFCPVPLTTMDPHHYEMGCLVANMAIDLIESETVTALDSVCLQPQLIVRQSSLRQTL